ncbi:ParB/RepB/Spo0J family partition protein [Arthrobacter rhombi]|uniref:ParB/RepB/Spo0J family partition protein n=1 Tax=Arthrobacter rhombi TaxID=71253 RepID=UPI003FCFAA83
MVNTSTFENMQIEKLRNHDENIRSVIGEIDELADSIKAQGILQPLTVAPHPTLDGDFTVIAGHRRLQAAKRAGLSYVPVVINHSLVSKADQITAMLVENLQRADITTIDEAKAYQQLELEGLNLNKIAKATGRARKTVVERLKLTKLSEQTQEKVAGHQVTLEKALDLARFAEYPEIVERLESNLSSYSWTYDVKSAERQIEWLEVTRPALEKAAEEAGVVRMDRPEGQRWQWGNKYNVVDTDQMGVEEAVEGGFALVLDEESNRQQYGYWMRERIAEPVREPSAEDIARAKASEERDQMIKDLATARDVETDFLAEKIGTPPKGVAQVLGARLVQDVIDDDTIKNLLGLDPADEDYGFVMRKLTADQLLLLLVVDQFRVDVGAFHEWNPNAYWSAGRMKNWADIRENHLGYTLTPIEEKVFDYWREVQAKAKADREAQEAEAAAAAEEGEDVA